MSHEQLDSIGVSAMTIIGLGFCVIAFRADEEINSDCPNSIIRYGWTIMQNIGLCIATLGLAYFICTSAGACYKDAGPGSMSRRQGVYIVFFFILGAINLILSALILSARRSLSDSEKQLCGNTDVSDKYAIVTLSMAAALCAIPIGIFVYGLYVSRKSGSSSSSSSGSL